MIVAWFVVFAAISLVLAPQLYRWLLYVFDRKAYRALQTTESRPMTRGDEF